MTRTASQSPESGNGLGGGGGAALLLGGCCILPGLCGLAAYQHSCTLSSIATHVPSSYPHLEHRVRTCIKNNILGCIHFYCAAAQPIEFSAVFSRATVSPGIVVTSSLSFQGFRRVLQQTTHRYTRLPGADRSTLHYKQGGHTITYTVTGRVVCVCACVVYDVYTWKRS